MYNSKKIKGFGKAIKIISRIISILLLVGFIIMLFSSVIMFALPDNLFSADIEISADVSLGRTLHEVWSSFLDFYDSSEALATQNFNISLNENGFSGQVKHIAITSDTVAGYIMLASIGLLLLSSVFYFAAKFGKTLQKNSDLLADESVSGLKNLSVSLLVWSIGSIILNTLYGILAAGSFIPNYSSISLNVNTEGLIAVILFMLFTSAVKYQSRCRKEQSAAVNQEEYSYYDK